MFDLLYYQFQLKLKKMREKFFVWEINISILLLLNEDKKEEK